MVASVAKLRQKHRIPNLVGLRLKLDFELTQLDCPFDQSTRSLQLLQYLLYRLIGEYNDGMSSEIRSKLIR